MFLKLLKKVLNIPQHNIKNIEINMIQKRLQELGQKYMNAVSEDSDIKEWELSLALLDNELYLNPYNNSLHSFSRGINEIFLEYLLKHYPSDKRLESRYKNAQEISYAKKYVYRKMLLITLGETLYITHRWEFENKKSYQKFKSFINEYVYYSQGRREIIYETEKCMNISEESLESIIQNVRKSILDYTKEQQLWHKKIENLVSFKK